MHFMCHICSLLWGKLMQNPGSLSPVIKGFRNSEHFYSLMSTFTA